MGEIFNNLYEMTAFSNLIADPTYLIMYAIAFVLLYLGIVKHYEPLLLVPIAFGVLIANFPGGDMGVIQANGEGIVTYIKDGVEVNKNIYEMSLPEIAHDLGIMNFLYYMLINSFIHWWSVGFDSANFTAARTASHLFNSSSEVPARFSQADL